jgi:hypothetical protein
MILTSEELLFLTCVPYIRGADELIIDKVLSEMSGDGVRILIETAIVLHLGVMIGGSKLYLNAKAYKMLERSLPYFSSTCFKSKNTREMVDEIFGYIDEIKTLDSTSEVLMNKLIERFKRR